MTILSTNHNPNNESVYARHRSTSKGTRSVITEVVQGLKGENRTIFSQIQGNFFQVEDEVERWLGGGLPFQYSPKVPATEGLVQNPALHRHPRRPVPHLDGLSKDCQRPAAGQSYGGYKEYLVVAAISCDKIDLIFSKYGFRPFHHFFHWQAVSEGVDGVHVDDYLLNPNDLSGNPQEGFQLV
jgi:hypothetical protein